MFEFVTIFKFVSKFFVDGVGKRNKKKKKMCDFESNMCIILKSIE